MIALLIIVCILLLLLFLRFGILIVLEESTQIYLKIGFIRFNISSLTDDSKKKNKKEKIPKKESNKPSKKRKPKITFDIVRSALPALFDSLHKGIKKTKKRILISPLKLSICFGGAKEPAKSSEMYGWTSAAVYSYMPRLEKVLNMKNPGIHMDVDYLKDKNEICGNFGLSICLFDILCILTSFAKPLLRWYKAHKIEIFPDEANIDS